MSTTTIGRVRRFTNALPLPGQAAPPKTTYHRYADGKTSELIYPYGRAFDRAYNSRGQMEYTGVSDGSGNWIFQFAHYAYRADGKLDHQDYGNGVSTTFGYDGRGMISSVAHRQNGSGPTLSSRSYTRDERDRILWSMRGSDPGANPAENGTGDVFYYDAEGQLTDSVHDAANSGGSPVGGHRPEHFEYDALGNRAGWNQVGSRGAVWVQRRDNGLNQYAGWSPSVIYHDDNFPGWGPAGNGVTMAEGWVTASYNALNQPIAIWSPAYAGTSNFVWFGFDPLGRCVKRTVGPSADTGSATFLYYDGWNLIQEGPATGGIVWDGWASYPGGAGGASRFYLPGARTDELVVSANLFSGQLVYHRYDGLGNALILTSDGGALLEQYFYDAFGSPYIYDASGNNLSYSPFGNRFLFTGREWLSDLKLYDYRNRMYQPELGRFLQPDPKEFSAGDYNLYRYCHNDPVNRSDPFGLQDEKKVKVDIWRKPIGSNIPIHIRYTESGNWLDTNIAHHASSKLADGVGGITNGTGKVNQSSFSDFDIDLNVNWSFNSRYASTDVVPRELQHVRDYHVFSNAFANNLMFGALPNLTGFGSRVADFQAENRRKYDPVLKVDMLHNIDPRFYPPKPFMLPTYENTENEFGN